MNIIVAGLKYDKVQLWVQFFNSKYYITVTPIYGTRAPADDHSRIYLHHKFL